MNTQILTGDDTRFLAQQPEYEVDIMVGQMTTLMQNITDLQNDTDDKVALLESQGWFKRMTNTLFGRNKATKQEIQKNNDKVVTYISLSVAQLYNMNLINERVICSLGNRMNEVYMQVVEANQEMLNMKGQISQIMAVQQQTLETMGAFVNKLNEKIESVDNFHMLISEIQNGMYNDSSKLYNLCSILSQLDKRQMDDSRKMNLLIDTMQKAGIITSDEITVFNCLQEIVALPQEKVGLIYLELCNFRNSSPANLFADMIESYHFLSKMEKMTKKKEVIIQHVLDKHELDTDAPFSIADISECFFENKQACFVNVANVQIDMNNSSSSANSSSYTSNNGDITDEEINEKIEKMLSVENPDWDAILEFIRPLAEQGNAVAQSELGNYCYFGEENYEEAVKWYRKAADQGIAYAQDLLGDCYYCGNGVNQDYGEAVKWYRKAAEQGSEEAYYDLGECYYYGYGVNQDYGEAVKWYRKSAEQGYGDAQCELGRCYLHGHGVSQDLESAKYWIEKAIENGSEDASELIDELNKTGIEYDPANKTAESLRYWAEHGDPYAKEDLGYSLFYGENDDDFGVYGIEEDVCEAAKWFEEAAKEGLMYSQKMFAEMCYEGIGVQQNYQRALKWYKKSAEQGNGWACFKLYQMYFNGLGCSENEDIGIDYYYKACNYLNDGKEICPTCGSNEYSLEEVSSGSGKGAAVGAGAGALFGLVGMAIGAAAGALINNSTITYCNCKQCGNKWEKII